MEKMCVCVKHLSQKACSIGHSHVLYLEAERRDSGRGGDRDSGRGRDRGRDCGRDRAREKERDHPPPHTGPSPTAIFFQHRSPQVADCMREASYPLSLYLVQK